jgi:hypothetical protein
MSNSMIEKAREAVFRLEYGGVSFTCEEMARAVLEAVREPNEAMAEALDNVNGVFAIVAWKAGIDAILNEDSL